MKQILSDGEYDNIDVTNMGCGAVYEAAPPVTRGRGFDPGYGENSVGSAVTLMGPATRDPD